MCLCEAVEIIETNSILTGKNQEGDEKEKTNNQIGKWIAASPPFSSSRPTKSPVGICFQLFDSHANKEILFLHKPFEETLSLSHLEDEIVSLHRI